MTSTIRNTFVALILSGSASTLHAQQTQQVIATAEMAETPEMKLRALLVVPGKEHSDNDYARNMLQAMFDKAKAANPKLTPRAFTVALHDKALAGNDADASYYYGAARFTGFGIAEGADKEVEGFIRPAFAAGKLEAVRDYAILTYRGAGVKKDTAAAYLLAKRAADGGLPSGMSLQAEFMEAGIGVKASMLDAVLLFQKAAQAGDVPAAYNLGMALNDEKPDAAMSWFKAAAGAGDDRAMFAYGMNELRGIGVPQNEKEGVDFVQSAAAAGNPDAQAMMGVFYVNGTHGVEKNTLVGRLYLESAAINGDSDAQIDFGLMNMDGLFGLKEDHDVGMSWMLKAAKQQNPRALQELRKRMK